MTQVQTPSRAHSGEASKPASAPDYTALRRGGASPGTARIQLRLGDVQARRFEAVFQAQVLRGGGEGRLPRFARHERHVAAVMAQGGFPALTERRAGRGCATLSLPLIWPEAKPEQKVTRGG